jgi:hypothetical protein
MFVVNIILNHRNDMNEHSGERDYIKIAVNPCDTSPDSIEILVTYTQKRSNTLKLYTKAALYSYLQGVFHLLQHDKKPFYSVDLDMTCYPCTTFYVNDLHKILPTIRQAVNLFA